MDKIYPNLVLTFLLENDGSFLLIKRADIEKNYPGDWAFPGGKVEVGETVVGALKREVQEETGLPLTGEWKVLDTYAFKTSVGIAFALRVRHRRVVPVGFWEYRWVSSLSDMAEFQRRIPGIDNHLVRALETPHWNANLEDFDLSERKYLNR